MRKFRSRRERSDRGRGRMVVALGSQVVCEDLYREAEAGSRPLGNADSYWMNAEIIDKLEDRTLAGGGVAPTPP